MSDVLKGLTGGGWGLLAGWIFPSLIVTALFSFFTAPAATDIPFLADVARQDVASRSLILVFTAAVLAVALSAVQVPLYRVLEGYLWPTPLRARGRRRHQVLRREVFQRYEAARGQEAGLILEKLQRYPLVADEVAPSRFGNTIRAFESYGRDRYGLDSQALWYELEAAAPERNSQAISQTRAGVDFFVCTLYLTAGLGALCIVAAAIEPEHAFRLLTVAACAIASLPAWYRLAVVATDQWASAVQALVNVGREPLAKSMGLSLPPTFDEERQMWERVKWLVQGQLSREAVAVLDPFRVSNDQQSDKALDDENLGVQSTRWLKCLRWKSLFGR